MSNKPAQPQNWISNDINVGLHFPSKGIGKLSFRNSKEILLNMTNRAEPKECYE